MIIDQAGQLSSSPSSIDKGGLAANCKFGTPPHKLPAKQMQILLCGCGNAVHVLTSYMGQQQHQMSASECEYRVNILSLWHADRLATSLPPDRYIQCIKDKGTDTFGKANMISSDPAQVVPGCSVIIFALPTDRHEAYLRAMLPYIQEGTIIGSMPGEGGFDLCVRNVLGAELAEKCTLFSLETLPWACRIDTFGQMVHVLGTKKDVDLCVYPGDQCWKIRDLLQSMIGPYPIVKTSPTVNFLGVTIMNPNAIAHPSIMYGLLRNWDGVTAFSKPPLFYQGMDEFTAETMEAVSNEVLAIKAAIQKQYPNIDLEVVRSIKDFFEEAYDEDIADHSSLLHMFLSNKGYDGLAMPTKQTESGEYLPLLDHRYFNEDLPCGILVQKGIAELAKVPTPVMDKIITWCQDRCIPPKEYLVDGKLMGKDLAMTKTPQRYGFKDLKSFMEANRYA